MNPDYLNLSRSQDLKNSKERFFYRFFEVLPGLLSWTTLIVAAILSWQQPVAAAIFIIAFAVYWFCKIFYLSCYQIAGFKAMKKSSETDWLTKLKKLEKWKEIYHLIILPTYKENLETVQNSFYGLIESQYPCDKMIVVLAIEERAGDSAQKTAQIIEEKFSQKFFKFLATHHPKDILGEVAGKGSNVAWAIKEVKKKIIDPLKIPYQNIVFSNFDIDTRIFPQYFSCLTYHYLTSKNPQRSSYQPIPVYLNNIWEAPAFSRIVASSGTFWQMMQQERPEQLVTFSSHSLSFEVLARLDYPTNVVSDDSRIFWKAYLYYDGDYRVTPINYPVSMDAVLANGFWRTLINQYKQQRRWAWGAENIPYLFFGFLKNKKISFFEKLRQIFIILDGFWSWSTSALLIFFLGWLPLFLGGEKFSFTLLSYNLPRLTSNLMTLAMVGMVISAIISFLILPPRPPKVTKWKNLFMVLQWILLPITLIFFGSIPALEAQTRLMFQKRLGFWVTEKAGKNPKELKV